MRMLAIYVCVYVCVCGCVMCVVCMCVYRGNLLKRLKLRSTCACTGLEYDIKQGDEVTDWYVPSPFSMFF